MILLFNNKITDHRIVHWGRPYERMPWLPVYDRLDIFKYCIASYTPFKPFLSKAVFYIELAQEFKDRQAELGDWILEHFPDADVNWFRNYVTRDWRENCPKIFDNNDPLVWPMGNDDHIYIDYDTNLIAEAIDLIANAADPMSIMYYSHYVEQCRLSNYYKGQLTDSGNYVKWSWTNYDSISMMTSQRFQYYWSPEFASFTDTDRHRVFRTDLFHDTEWQEVIHKNIEAPIYSPTRGLVHHYDGYSLVGNLRNVSPPLIIPPGFFEKDIKIRIGYTDRKEGWTNLNPAAEWLYTAAPHGADYRWTQQDIPAFWHDYISEIDVNPDYDTDLMYQARDAAFMAVTRQPMAAQRLVFTTDPATLPPAEWYKNHLRSK